MKMKIIKSNELSLLLGFIFSGFFSSFTVQQDNKLCPNETIVTDSNPQQIHLSLGNKPTEIVVTWTTFNPEDASTVWYGEEWEMDLKVEGSSTPFFATDDHGNAPNGTNARILYIHRAVLTDLNPLTTYYYECGSEEFYSTKTTFKTLSDSNTDWSPRMLVYGDLGYVNGVSIPAIQQDVENGDVDLVFHNGDITYFAQNCHSNKSDAFMNKIQGIASRVPYQTGPGNHESEFLPANYSNYRARFSMYNMLEPSENRADHYYAFYLGPALIVSISTDMYFFNANQTHYKGWQFFTQAHIDWQNHWLDSVLKEANKPENRALHPWVIVLGHRPLYCTCDFGIYPDCTTEAAILRENLEQMFYKYKVDLVLAGHEHTYERTYPVYQNRVYNGPSELEPYTNAQAPVYVISGIPGMFNLDNAFDPVQPEWSAFRQNQTFGYGIMEIVNRTHLVWKQKDSSGPTEGQVSDTFTLIKDLY